MEVTLTFDNGPEPAVTPRVLEVLGRFGIRSTFFVLGSKLADPARRALAKSAHGAGHWIGNHTMTHSTPLGRLLPTAWLAVAVRTAHSAVLSDAHAG